MLTENRHVRQEPGQRRRWFEHEGLELIVWLDGAGGVDGFQLCHSGHALTWHRGGGFTHAQVDEGDQTPFKNLTPVLVPDGAVPWAEITGKFQACSGSLEPDLQELILGRLLARS